MHRPLADEIRPLELDDVVGQKHILGPGGLLRRVIDSGSIPNMVFYGPSGTGKTTVANIIARKTDRSLRRLNATNASLADIKAIIAELDTMLTPGGVLLYLDEIQYFNKKQQQSLLEFIEDGRITLIASTTENPYFYVYNALLSRSTVFEFKSVPPAEVVPAVRRAVDIISKREGIEAVVEPGAAEHIAQSCGGDVRKAMNSVELLFSAAPRKDGVVNITLQDAKDATQSSAMRYDREGDEHFDSVSALMKSLRGSDPDAALHYLARTLEAGDLIGACRRLLCSASEDIGLAYPQAAAIVKACVDSALQLGLPELKYTKEGMIHIYEKDEVLYIEDTGIGIKPEDLPRVFEKGFTGHNGRVDKKASGLGLYLCQQIIHNLGYQISIESTLGKGTVVAINFHVDKLQVE